MPTQLLTVKEVAVLLQLSDRLTRKWVREGIIPSFKIGSETRIHPAKLEEWLAQQAGLSTAPVPRKSGRPRTNHAKKLKQDSLDVFGDIVVH